MEPLITKQERTDSMTENVKRCKTCVLPTSLSNITFSEDEECNVCQEYRRSKSERVASVKSEEKIGGCKINCVNGHRYVNLIWTRSLLWPSRPTNKNGVMN